MFERGRLEAIPVIINLTLLNKIQETQRNIVFTF